MARKKRAKAAPKKKIKRTVRAAEPRPPLIMVVDHDEHVRGFYEFLLGAQGYEVRAAAQWEDDMVEREATRPHLVVTSLNVFDDPARRWVSRNAKSPGAIPVLFLTAASEDRIYDEIPASPTIRVLSKPAGAERITKAVAELVRAGTAADLPSVL
jgi:DNA-binding response OmpR family regulator